MNTEDPNRTTPQENGPHVTRVQEETQRERLAPELSVPGFEVEAPLGRGGMGAVYRAKQTGLNRTVALKMLIAGPFADANLRARFLLEAESIAALEHPHIVKVFAFGESGGHPYLAMEYAPNGALSERVPAGGLPAREAAEIVAKLAGAVAHAHSRGVVHRDIKPQNVLIGADNEPRLTDFGLAKVGRADRNLSVTGQVLGTPAYMAPEQAAGKVREIGTAADVYALGAVLYDLCTGRPPFQGDSVAVTLQKVLTEEPARPRALNPAVPRDLETICLKCLEKDPAKRYATAQALADDLLRWLRNEPIAARPAGALERASKWVKRNKVAALAGAAVSVALLAGTAVSVAFGLEAQQKRKDAEAATGREEQEKKDAVTARLQAETNLREAVKTTASFVALATELEETLGAQTGLTLRLLAQTETNLARLRTLGDSPEAREQLAALQALTSKLQLARGRTDLALAAGNEAVAGYDALRTSPHADVRAGLWLALHARARVHSDRGTTGPALADVRRARAVADELAAAQPANYRWQVFQAKSNMLVGALEWAQGRFTEGDANQAKALEQATAAVNTPEGTGDVSARRLLARAHYNRGAALERREEPGAPAEYLKAHDLLAPLAPGSPSAQADLIDALIARAGPAHQSGDEALARQQLARAEQLADGLLLIDPNSAEWQRLRFYAGITRTQTLARADDDPAAALREQIALFARLTPIAERIVRDDPANAVWRQRLVLLRRSTVMNTLATKTKPTDDERNAVRARAAELVGEGERLVAEDPENYNALQSAFTTGRVGLFLLGQLGGTRTAADVRAVYQPVHDFYARRRNKEPERAEWRVEAARTHHDALTAFAAGGHAREAEAEAQAGLDALNGVPDAPNVALLRSTLAWYLAQERLQKKPPDAVGAIDTARTATEALEPWVVARPASDKVRKQWTDSATLLAVALRAEKRFDEAERVRARVRAVRLQIAENQLAGRDFLPKRQVLLSSAASQRIAIFADKKLAQQTVSAAEKLLEIGRTSDRTIELLEACLIASASTDATDPNHRAAVRRYLAKIADAYEALADKQKLAPEEERVAKAVRAELDELDRTAPEPRAK